MRSWANTVQPLSSYSPSGLDSVAQTVRGCEQQSDLIMGDHPPCVGLSVYVLTSCLTLVVVRVISHPGKTTDPECRSTLLAMLYGKPLFIQTEIDTHGS